MKEKQEKEIAETETQVFRDKYPEGLISNEELPPVEPSTTPAEQKAVTKAIVSRIPKPAPNYCPRGLTFHNKNSDNYCHTLCAKTHPTEYAACQELQLEEPEMFVAKKTSTKH